MNFTREPIIETILSPREGYKLGIKNSKVAGAEELFVDVVEVVSFGQAVFFRGQEKPKPFLVPVSDYEVFEVKDTRMVLKNVSHDRNIKIGGGREAFPKQAPAEEVAKPQEAQPVQEEGKGDRKRDRRRNRRRRLVEEKKEDVALQEEEVSSSQEEGELLSPPTPKVSSALFAHLLPPPPVLISEKLGKLKEAASSLPEPEEQQEREELREQEVQEEEVVVTSQEETPAEEEEFFS